MADVTITENTPTFPVAPDGFTAVTLFGMPSFYGLTGTEDLETASFTLTTPFQVTADEWDGLFQNLVAQVVSVHGGDLAAYGVWEMPVQDIVVPTSICIAGLPCIDLTSGIFCNLPFLPPCLGGSTLLTGYDYRIWVLTDVPGAGVGSYVRGDVRGQITIIIQIVLAILAALLGPVIFADVVGILTGKITAQQIFDEQVKPLLPASQIDQAISPLIFLGFAAILSTIAIAVITKDQAKPPQLTTSYGGNVSIPTPYGGRVGANFETKRS